MNTTNDEMSFLESKIQTYVTSDSSQDRLIKQLAIRTFTPHIKPGGTALEFGCCDGFMTFLISNMVENLTVVDGSKTFISLAKNRVGDNVQFTHSLFENYISEKKFNYIFATYVLEHVNDAINFLNLARNLLTTDGLLFLVVPNARALSRQLARHMGIINDLYELTPNDINHGHRRVYDRPLLNRDIEAAELIQISQGGLLLKPFADFQMNKLIDTEIIGKPQQEGLYKMGLEYPDFAGSLFSVCRKNN